MQHRVRHVIGSPRFTLGTVAAAGLVGLFVAFLVPNAYTTVLPPFLLAGAAVGAVAIRSGTERPAVIGRLHAGLRSRQLLLLGSLLVWPATVAAYVHGGFETTLAVHALVVLSVGLAAVAAVTLASTPIRLGLVLGTALLYRGMVYFAGAVPIGNDALFHLRATEAIAATGSLDPLATSKYWYAPLYHLLVAGASLIPGIGVRDAAFLTVTVVATVVPPLALWYFLRRYWTDAVGVLGALLYVSADHAILNAVHATPTSLGVAWVAVLFVATDRALADGAATGSADAATGSADAATGSADVATDIGDPASGTARAHDESGLRWLAIFGAALLALLFTHQLSLFVATVGLLTYIAVRVLWRGRLGLRAGGMALSLVGAFLLQGTITEYGGPAGETGSFIGTVAPSIVAALLDGLRAPARAGAFPSGVTVSGADALTPVQLFGTGLLFGLAVIGAVSWVRRRRIEVLGPVVAIGSVVTVMCTIVFVPPAFGVNVFIPGRWFPFIYLFLAALGGPAVAALVAATRSRVGAPVARASAAGGRVVPGGSVPGGGPADAGSAPTAGDGGVTVGRSRSGGAAVGLLLPALVVLALVIPYAAVMTTNGYGAVDGPVLDDAPGASRISTTPVEAAAFEYAIGHRGSATLVGSFGSWRVIDRWYGADVVLYRTAVGTTGTTIDGEQLVVSRAYDGTDHASYMLEYEGRTIRVYGSLPGAGPTDDVVYDNGEVTLYRTDN